VNDFAQTQGVDAVHFTAVSEIGYFKFIVPKDAPHDIYISPDGTQLAKCKPAEYRLITFMADSTLSQTSSKSVSSMARPSCELLFICEETEMR
jgi:hypothetical protein